MMDQELNPYGSSKPHKTFSDFLVVLVVDMAIFCLHMNYLIAYGIYHLSIQTACNFITVINKD